MRELDEKEGVIKFVQDKAETLLAENHPARLTIEVRETDILPISQMTTYKIQ